MKLLTALILLLGVALGSEELSLELGLKKKRKTLVELREFRQALSELLREEFREVAPGIKVKKDCKVERGIASWYGGRFHGRKTANGEIYDLFKFTAASRTLPLGTYVLVRNEENGKVITVRVNDRGPYIDGRIIDLSQAAAYKLGMMLDGVAMVQVIPLRCLAPESLTRYYDSIIIDIANTY
ncbi:septal ring lytic transglycosylase RlpA family protein [Hydrogenivirga sp. 128-5-R1-1]|uniref:septal ring lytic transglycosylase RlpA family protein n=1 Tax=Hydrogenivirga sp. 128-5-R1-1 TaxID=392423 RepID=UPI00015F0C91|nr:septal ring lytic transglycosylase RlpA family protein [Hydrogenivirga sp. 128-5-R1-1]EDP75872.1 rare lipoprotein A [Hydrogenivirga sp. 128-5-R1-1]